MTLKRNVIEKIMIPMTLKRCDRENNDTNDIEKDYDCDDNNANE